VSAQLRRLRPRSRGPGRSAASRSARGRRQGAGRALPELVPAQVYSLSWALNAHDADYLSVDDVRLRCR